MLRWIGAAMLLIACAGTGIRCSRDLRRRVLCLRGLLEKLERLCMEVCRLLTPLPAVMPILTGRAIGSDEFRERSFPEIWKQEMDTLGCGEAERQVLVELGCALSRGDEPERAFLAAQERLRALLREAEAEAEGKCRLCSSLGICTGLLLAIVLI